MKNLLLPILILVSGFLVGFIGSFLFGSSTIGFPESVGLTIMVVGAIAVVVGMFMLLYRIYLLFKASV